MVLSKEIPAFVYIREFLTTEKFSRTKHTKFLRFKKSPRACTYEDFWPLENSVLRNIPNFGVFKRNPHTRVQTRSFDHWKIQPYESYQILVLSKEIPAFVYIREFLTTGKFSRTKHTKFCVLKNHHARVHTRIFDHWKIQSYETYQILVSSKEIPARVHIRGFLTAGKFVRTKSKNYWRFYTFKT